MVFTSATFDNIRTACFKNIRTVLLNAVSDVGTNVYGSYPVKDISLPLIVIENPKSNGNVWGNGNNKLTRKIGLLVSIYAKQAEKLDQYAETIESTIWSSSSTLESNNIYIENIEDNEAGKFEDIAGNKGHSKSLSLMLELK